MKSRTFYSAIALVAGLLVLVGVAGFWGLTSQTPRALLTQGGQTVPTAAQFVPRQAPVMAALLARPDRVWQLRQLLTPASRRFVARQEWQALKQSLETTVGWAYDTDVRPWLGAEVTFAVTTPDLDHDETNGLQAGYLALLSCRDVEAAREAGTLDLGLETVRVDSFTELSNELLRTDPVTGAETRLVSLKVKRQLRPLRFRSEEHTSELQSPVPTSYAVFCLKKKNTK